MTPAVFLSASVPDPRRDEKYYSTADVIAIREAVRALSAVVLKRTTLVFGGHPAITPLVRQVAESIDALGSVRMYQSRWFDGDFPLDNAAFPWIRFVDPERGRDESVSRMRAAMFTENRFRAAVFIGGMEGVEREFELFTARHPRAKVLPVGSTGAAASLLLSATTVLAADVSRALETDTVYGALFERLLWPRPRARSRRR